MRIVLVICALVVFTGTVLFAVEMRTPREEPQSTPLSAQENVPDPVAGAIGSDPGSITPANVASEPIGNTPGEAGGPAKQGKPEAETEPDGGRVEQVERSPPDSGRSGDLVERIDDRSIRLDGRFTLRGNGTERDPFNVTWELLASARDTIDAAEGELEPPAHIALLDGAWVRVDGYYSSPVVSDSVREVLVTLNRWDGCCIGLPPSPFDCIDTDLREPIDLESKHLVRLGTVTGRMRVQQFAIGSWLMGLYSLEEADINSGLR